MSGRELEPISAFFPSIDRNLMRDLDRHLRHAAPQPHIEPAPQEMDEPAYAAPEQAASRPSTADILDAVEQAAASMGSMTARIHELEGREAELEATNEQLKQKLSELLQRHQAAEAAARGEADRAGRAEQLAAHHVARANGLENDLAAALGDLTRIAEAITGSLGGGHRG